MPRKQHQALNISKSKPGLFDRFIALTERHRLLLCLMVVGLIWFPLLSLGRWLNAKYGSSTMAQKPKTPVANKPSSKEPAAIANNDTTKKINTDLRSKPRLGKKSYPIIEGYPINIAHLKRSDVVMHDNRPALKLTFTHSKHAQSILQSHLDILKIKFTSIIKDNTLILSPTQTCGRSHGHKAHKCYNSIQDILLALINTFGPESSLPGIIAAEKRCEAIEMLKVETVVDQMKSKWNITNYQVTGSKLEIKFANKNEAARYYTLHKNDPRIHVPYMYDETVALEPQQSKPGKFQKTKTFGDLLDAIKSENNLAVTIDEGNEDQTKTARPSPQ